MAVKIRRFSAKKQRHDNAGAAKENLQDVDYSDYPAVEWVIWIENRGTANPPILDSIQAFNAVLAVKQQPKASAYENHED